MTAKIVMTSQFTEIEYGKCCDGALEFLVAVKMIATTRMKDPQE